MIFYSVNLVLSKIITTFAPQTHAKGVCTTLRLREQTYLKRTLTLYSDALELRNFYTLCSELAAIDAPFGIFHIRCYFCSV